MEIVAEKLTADAFAPYGDVLESPEALGRVYYEDGLGNLRPHARPSLSMTRRAHQETLPLEAKLLERHEFSSQSFVPLEPARWLIIVCPHAPGGGPDVGRVRAFLAEPGQGVTYRPNTWHHGLTVLDHPTRFAVFMWRDGTSGDEEFVPVAPFIVRLAG